MGMMDPSPSWFSWFLIALPVCIFIDLCIWGILLVIFRPEAPSSGVPHELTSQAHLKEPFTSTQVFILFITFGTIALWCFESSLQNILGEMGVIAIIPMVAFYGTGILTKDDWNSMLWSVVMLAMGNLKLDYSRWYCIRKSCSIQWSFIRNH